MYIKGGLGAPETVGSFYFDLPDGVKNFEELEKSLMEKAMRRASGFIAEFAKLLLGLRYMTLCCLWEKLKSNNPVYEEDRIGIHQFSDLLIILLLH